MKYKKKLRNWRMMGRKGITRRIEVLSETREPNSVYAR